MVKDTILADTVKDLIKKNKDKDTLIASKHEELKQAAGNYIMAKKYNDQLTKAYSLISSNIKAIESDLSKGLISQELAGKALNKFGVISSKLAKAKKAETLIAGIQQIKKTQTALVSYKKTLADKKTVVASTVKKTQDVSKKQVNKETILSSRRNVLNSDGWKGNRTLCSNTYTSNIDEMTAELTRIAGLDK
jgi:hypothetical protein